MAAWLADCTAADPESIAIAIEVPHDAVVESLLLSGFAVFSINTRSSPIASATVARRPEPRMIGVLPGYWPMLCGPTGASFRRLELPDPRVVELRDLTRTVEDLTRQRTRLSNRIRGQLGRYYPQFAELSDNLTEHWLLELWRMAPAPAKAQALRKARVARLAYAQSYPPH